MQSFKLITMLVLLLLLTGSFTQVFANPASHRVKSHNSYNYELLIESPPPVVMKPVPVKIKITDPDGKPVTGARVSCSLTMPAMAMPTNEPPIKEAKVAGQYDGIFLLTMGGLWYVEVSSVYSSGAKDSVEIPLVGVNTNSNDDNINQKLEGLFHEKEKSK